MNLRIGRFASASAIAGSGRSTGSSTLRLAASPGSAARTFGSPLNLQARKWARCAGKPALWLGPVVRCPIDHPFGDGEGKFPTGDNIAAEVNASPDARLRSTLTKRLKGVAASRANRYQSTLVIAIDEQACAAG